MSENATPLTTEHLQLMRDDIAECRAEMRAEFAKVSVEFEEMKKRFRASLEFSDRAGASGDVTLQGVPIDQR